MLSKEIKSVIEFSAKQRHADPRVIYEYVMQFDWHVYGAGKDRIVVGDDNFALKLPRSFRGEAANVAEGRRWEKSPASHRKWLLPVLDYDYEGKWLLMKACDIDLAVPKWWVELIENNLRPRGVSMPPRTLLDAVEHAYSGEDWCLSGGHPVLFDYA